MQNNTSALFEVDEVQSVGDELQYKVKVEVVMAGKKTLHTKLFNLRQLAYETWVFCHCVLPPNSVLLARGLNSESMIVWFDFDISAVLRIRIRPDPNKKNRKLSSVSHLCMKFF